MCVCFLFGHFFSGGCAWCFWSEGALGKRSTCGKSTVLCFLKPQPQTLCTYIPEFKLATPPNWFLIEILIRNYNLILFLRAVVYDENVSPLEGPNTLQTSKQGRDHQCFGSPNFYQPLDVPSFHFLMHSLFYYSVKILVDPKPGTLNIPTQSLHAFMQPPENLLKGPHRIQQ